MAKKQNKIELNKKTKEIKIKDFTITNPEVYDFLSDKKDKELWLEKAIIIGSAGLKQIVLTDNVDFIEKKFNEFLQKAKESFFDQSEEINKKIEDTFSIDKKSSAIAQFTSKLDNTFDLKKEDSPLAQFKELIEKYFDSKKGVFKEIRLERKPTAGVRIRY